MAIRPYLFFGGNCRDAFTRYQEILGGELMVMTMADAPGDEAPPPGKEHYVIHAAITFPDGDFLMGSDDPTAEPGTFEPVRGMMASYDATDADDAHRVHAALAEGGEVTQAVEPTFFSTAFGMCTDRFGTPWMIVAPQPDASD